MNKPKPKQRLGVGQGAPAEALTVAFLPLGLLIAVALAGLFAATFRLGAVPPLISVALWVALIGASAVTTGQLRASAAAGTRLTLAHLGLVCLLGGVAAAPPADFEPLMFWSLAAVAGAATAILAVEVWIAEKIGAAGPFSRRLASEAHALLILATAVLLWRSGKAGGWVVAAGAVHYAVLAASLALPALPPSNFLAQPPVLRLAAPLLLAAALAPAVPPLGAAGLGVAAIIAATIGVLRRHAGDSKRNVNE